jgi:hypothetical protein
MMETRIRERLPERLEELEATDRLVAWSLRRWINGWRFTRPAEWSLVWNELAGQYGPRAARQALLGLAGIVHALCAYARRPIRYHQPCCTALGIDEYRIILLVSACRSGDMFRAGGLAEWLVRSEGQPGLLSAADRLATALNPIRDAGNDRAEAQPQAQKRLDHVAAQNITI